MRNKLLLFAVIFFIGCSTDELVESCDDNTQILEELPISTHDLYMYPSATDSLVRHIITLPPQMNEEDYKIEIYAGRVIEIDCNSHGFIGIFTEKDVEGWGYPYFEFNTNGQIWSTLIGCPESSLHDEFVHGESKLVRYNSRLPLVVYTPPTYTVRYKLWVRNTHEYIADEG